MNRAWKCVGLAAAVFALSGCGSSSTLRFGENAPVHPEPASMSVVAPSSKPDSQRASVPQPAVGMLVMWSPPPVDLPVDRGAPTDGSMHRTDAARGAQLPMEMLMIAEMHAPSSMGSGEPMAAMRAMRMDQVMQVTRAFMAERPGHMVVVAWPEQPTATNTSDESVGTDAMDRGATSPADADAITMIIMVVPMSAAQMGGAVGMQVLDITEDRWMQCRAVMDRSARIMGAVRAAIALDTDPTGQACAEREGRPDPGH